MSEATNLYVLRDEYNSAVKERLAASNDPALNLQAAMRAEKATLLALIKAELDMAETCIGIIKKRFDSLTAGGLSLATKERFDQCDAAGTLDADSTGNESTEEPEENL